MKHYVLVRVVKEIADGKVQRTDVRTVLDDEEVKHLIADMGSKRLERGAGKPGVHFGHNTLLKLPEELFTSTLEVNVLKEVGVPETTRKGHPESGHFEWGRDKQVHRRLLSAQDAALSSAKEVQAGLLIRRWRGKKKTEYFGVGAPSVLIARAWSAAHTRLANTDTVLKLMRPDTTLQGSMRYIKLHGSLEVPENARTLDLRDKSLPVALRLFNEWDERCT